MSRRRRRCPRANRRRARADRGATRVKTRSIESRAREDACARRRAVLTRRCDARVGSLIPILGRRLPDLVTTRRRVWAPRSHAYKPRKDGYEPEFLLAQILPASVPSHSTFKSSDKNLTSPFSAAFSHPKMFCGKLQNPSVTVRERSKFALDVAARFLSFNSLFASVFASKSEVRSARAGAT